MPASNHDVSEDVSVESNAISHPKPPPSLWRTGISSALYLFLVYFSLMVGAVPFGQLVLERACADLNISWDHCDDGVPGYDDAQRAAARYGSKLTLAGGIFSVLSCPIYGILGDALGRRLPLLMPLLGGTLMSFSQVAMPASLANNGLVVMAFLTSMMGGLYVTNQTAFATLSDVSQHVSAKQRSATFSLVEAFNSIGIFVGPTFGGWCADRFGNQQAMWFCFGGWVVNLVITLFTYRETLDKKDRRPFNWARANPIASLAMFAKDKTTTLLGLVMLCGMVALDGGSCIEGLYVLKTTDMDGASLGMLYTIRLGIGFAGLLFAVPLFSRCMKLPRLLTISLLNQAVGWLLLSMSVSNWQFFAASATGVFIKIMFPLVRTGMTNSYGRARYGESLAAVGTLEQLSGLIAPLMFQTLYAATVDTSIPPIGCISFFVAALVALVGMFLTLAISDMPENCDSVIVAANPLQQSLQPLPSPPGADDSDCSRGPDSGQSLQPLP